MSEGPEPATGLYVHVPFCEAKCTYCHFAIDPRRPDEARQERYLRALLSEMEATEAFTADTLYFGGGTPSLLSLPRLARLVDLGRRRFGLPDDAEVTLEANPRDLEAAGYRALRALGVNRLSLGVQSADDEVLLDMGRLHTAESCRATVADARAAGFQNLSIDLILGWPGETRARWRGALELAGDLAPDHVSLYVLEVEGKTLLQHRARRGQLDLPDADLVADLYEETVLTLAAMGIERYEISNFARPGFESRHNRKYWDDAPFVGFGMAAHSYRDGRRSWNLETYGGYCAAVERGGGAAARAGERLLDPTDHASEALFTGLRRREGVDLAAFAARHHIDPLSEWGERLRDSFDAGLLDTVSGRLRLTGKGMLLSNEVFRALV
jgi:oxygen-independent coproporphyrinogen III oxidase